MVNAKTESLKVQILFFFISFFWIFDFSPSDEKKKK